jgi:hypothetical protein
MFVRTQILVDLPKILQSFLYYCIKKGILEKYLLQNPKRRKMEMNGIKRERESGKSSSITIAQDMVSWE